MTEEAAPPKDDSARDDSEGALAVSGDAERVRLRMSARLVAAALELAVVAIEPIPVEDYERCLDALRRDKGRYDALGCMFDPFGMEAKTLFFEQGIEKLEAMIAFRRACEKLQEFRRKGGEAAGTKEKMELLFGGLT